MLRLSVIDRHWAYIFHKFRWIKVVLTPFFSMLVVSWIIMEECLHQYFEMGMDLCCRLTINKMDKTNNFIC